MSTISQALAGRGLWIAVGIALLIAAGETGYWLGISNDHVIGKSLAT